jgi:flagellar L-ring protein precursor FlgH
MSLGLIGKKLGMTKVYDAKGDAVAVTVVDVLPNGNLVVEGAKIIRAGQESQYAYMRGIVRPIDIASDNTILSTKIADAQVEFIPEGELTEAQKKGWLVRMWDKIRPMP